MMAFLYPWATKEYLLWNMTIGQIIVYHNKGIELKWPESTLHNAEPGFVSKSAEELRNIRDNIFKQMDEEKEQRAKSKLEKSNEMKEAMRAKYGDIG